MPLLMLASIAAVWLVQVVGLVSSRQTPRTAIVEITNAVIHRCAMTEKYDVGRAPVVQ